MAALTLDAAKQHLNIEVDKFNNELLATIAAAESAIAQLVGPLEPTTVTSRIYGSASYETNARLYGASSSLELPVTPVISITSITNYAGTVMLNSLFYVDPESGNLAYTSGVGSFGFLPYVVVYQAGRTVCPPDLLYAVKELVRHLWESQRGPSRRPGSNAPDPATSAAGYLLPYRVQELLAPYMRIAVG